MELDEPRLTMLPEDVKECLHVLKVHIELIESHCASQPVEGFTEQGREKCVTLYKNLVQQICDMGGPVLGGLGGPGVHNWTPRQREHCARKLTQ